VAEAEWNAAPEFPQKARAVNAQKETLRAAGVVDLISCLLSIRDGVTPATTLVP